MRLERESENNLPSLASVRPSHRSPGVLFFLGFHSVNPGQWRRRRRRGVDSHQSSSLSVEMQ